MYYEIEALSFSTMPFHDRYFPLYTIWSPDRLFFEIKFPLCVFYKYDGFIGSSFIGSSKVNLLLNTAVMDENHDNAISVEEMLMFANEINNNASEE